MHAVIRILSLTLHVQAPPMRATATSVCEDKSINAQMPFARITGHRHYVRRPTGELYIREVGVSLCSCAKFVSDCTLVDCHSRRNPAIAVIKPEASESVTAAPLSTSI